MKYVMSKNIIYDDHNGSTEKKIYNVYEDDVYKYIQSSIDCVVCSFVFDDGGCLLGIYLSKSYEKKCTIVDIVKMLKYINEFDTDLYFMAESESEEIEKSIKDYIKII